MFNKTVSLGKLFYTPSTDRTHGNVFELIMQTHLIFLDGISVIWTYYVWLFIHGISPPRHQDGASMQFF